MKSQATGIRIICLPSATARTRRKDRGKTRVRVSGDARGEHNLNRTVRALEDPERPGVDSAAA
jgi:hypothetical protein